MDTETLQPGKVWLVGAGPGEPDLITWRGREVLEQAEVVLHDALSHPGLLELCRQAEIRNVGKRYGERSPKQDWINEQILECARSGRRVVRLKGGDPMLFARGGEEALALAAAGIPFEIVPGLASPIAASEFAGIPLTHRDVSSSVTFITGSDQDGKEWSPEAWTRLATATGTICVLMGMRRIADITKAIIAGGRAEATPAAVVQWGARPEQRTVVGTLGSIASDVHQAGLSNPAVIIVGEVVALRETLGWYEKLPLFGERVLVARAPHQAQGTVSALRKMGASALVAPAIEICPLGLTPELEQAIRNLESYDWVIFTSENGVSSFFAALGEAGRDARAFGQSRIMAIGPKTAASLRKFGLKADEVATEYVAESLVSDLLKKQPRRVLLPRARVARDVVPERLRERGVFIDVLAVYETQAVSGEAQQHLGDQCEQATAILLTSSSMVDSLAQALGSSAKALLQSKQIICIGPVTAARARHYGWEPSLVAAQYTVEGALASWVEARQTKRH
jgi:uroporphyrinogen III methyltransferase / synthase